MSILKILFYPDQRLRTKAQPVNLVNSSIQKIINNMFETMYANGGIGLAATQVNIHQQIIVIDLLKNHKEPLVLINPSILEKIGNISISESCLSIPNESGLVLRAKNIKVLALNNFGKKIEIQAKNLLSICIQHEIDHLYGKLFIDYLPLLERQKILKRLQKISKYKKYFKTKY